MNTAFLLMAQYNGQAIISVDVACKDYFGMKPDQFMRKVTAGEINIPVTRLDPSSQKSARGIHINDLASWIDVRREAAIKECDQLQGRR
jgi:hypothetical protein